jgi:AraC family transcriptional regulator
MGWVESLQKAIDYMENHLLDDISIESIAKQANVSEFHFQRIFSVLTDITVGEYLRRRRLTLAAQELSTTDSKVIEVALKYGYDTPESFSKAFRRQHGITPSQAPDAPHA